MYGQSVLGADKEFKAWVLKADEYTTDIQTDKDGQEVRFRHKSRMYAKTIHLENKNGKRNLSYTMYQRQMVYYSQKYAHKQKKERELVIAKSRELITNPGAYTNATSYGASKYIKDIAYVKTTGEIAQSSALFLDIRRIEEEATYDGYYSIVTSEMDYSDEKIHRIYKGLWEIEESFKIIKHEFKARPIYLQREDHIKAHFLICFVSLLIMRILEYKLEKKYPFTRIRESLQNYSCSHITQNYYLFDYHDEILSAIEEVFALHLKNKIMTPSQIKSILQHKRKTDCRKASHLPY